VIVVYDVDGIIVMLMLLPQDGDSVLALAARGGSTEVVEILLRAGLNVNAINKVSINCLYNNKVFCTNMLV